MNILKTYYEIDVDIELNDLVKFTYNSNNYVLIRNDNIDFNLLNYLFYYIDINKPILNVYNSYLTKYENKYYFLFYDKVGKVSIEEIISFLNQPLFISNNNIHEKWCKKVDYHEYQITQFGAKYFILRESINYVVGLSEIGIQLINTIDLSSCFSCICHKQCS